MLDFSKLEIQVVVNSLATILKQNRTLFLPVHVFMMATIVTETVNTDDFASGSRIVPTTVAIVAFPTVPASHREKSKKFVVTNFKRWQQKILFYLTTLN